MSISNKNYFFVVTGLQVINCVEYIHATNSHEDVNILIVCNKEKNARFEVNSTIKLYDWDKIIYLPPSFILDLKSTSLKLIFNLMYSWIRLKFINFKSSNIIGNDLTIFFRYVTKHKNLKDVIFIDDGNGTVNYNPQNPFNDFKGRSNKFIYRFLSIDKHVFYPNIFFTAYPDYIKLLPNQKIIINNFSFISNLKKHTNKVNKVYFIGDPHVERGYMTKEQFFDTLKFVNKLFDNNVIYVPRVYEGDEKLNEIKNYMQVLKNDTPFENYIVSSEFLPIALIAFHSTVLFNLNKMCGDSMKYYFIKIPNFTNDVHMNNLTNIWLSLKEFATELQPFVKD